MTTEKKGRSGECRLGSSTWTMPRGIESYRGWDRRLDRLGGYLDRTKGARA